MSSNLTQAEKKSRKAFSKTMKAQIKKRLHTQLINGVQFTYGMLQKVSQSSLFNNERLVILKGHSTFGYASSLPQQTLLPFVDEKNIPKCKGEVQLNQLSITNQKQVLILEFQQNNKKQKTKWQFRCGSKVRAIEWRQRLQNAKNQKIAHLQNNPIKVILQDPNEQNQDSDQFEKSKVNPLQQRKEDSPQLSNIVIVEQKQRQSSQRDRNKSKQQVKRNQDLSTEKETKKQQQFNIFDSLLSTSPVKQPLQSSKLNLSPEYDNQKTKTNLKFSRTSQERQVQSQGKLKQQFLKRKLQEFQLKQELNEENNSLSNNVIRSVTETKFQIEKLKKQWGYQFAKGVSEYQIVELFKAYIENITVKIVDELALQPRKRYYKPVHENTESMRYQIDGVSLEFFLNQLNYVLSFQGKGSIISNIKTKQAYQQLKNYNYILQITKNKGRIRVPLVMCVQYKGIVGIAKVIIPETQSYQNLQSLQKELDLLQAESHVNNSVFQNGENGRIIPLQSKIYEKIARTQSSFNPNNKKFDICFVQGLKHYLPQDFNRLNSQNSKNNQSFNNSTNVLRRQLVQDEQNEEVIFYGENLHSYVNKLKIPTHLKQGIDVLTEVSKSIFDRVSALVATLENLDEVITNSKDLSSLMHGYGINMRYLGTVLEKSKQSWLKGLIISEIAARCSKYFLKFDLQDCILNLNESKVQNVRRYQVNQVISFFNKTLGNSEQSDAFWNQLSRQSQEYYQCYLDRNLINVGYFIQALQQQCKIKLVSISNCKDDFFKVPEPLTSDNFSAFEIKSKTFDLQFTELYNNVVQHLKDLSQQSYEHLSILLNIPRKGSLPPHFNLNNFNEKIILYLINWLPPSQGQLIYYPEQIQLGQVLPTKILYLIKLTEIKWLLKDRKEQEAQKVKDFIVEHIHKWLGQYHPILSELYDLFSRYYLTSKTQEKKSITYCKSSIKNIEKLLSQRHIKLADNYYMLAEIYINYQKKTEALNALKRAKDILQSGEGEELEAYGIIMLRMGELLLASNRVPQALQQGLKSYVKLTVGDDIQRLVQCVQVIGRCYEVSGLWDQYKKFVEELVSSNNKYYEVSQNNELLQKYIKVIMMPYFNQFSKNPQVSRQILSILSQFSSLSSVTPSTQNNSYNYIKSLMQIDSSARTFPNQFIFILSSEIEELLEEIQQSGIMSRWKGFQSMMGSKSFINKINSMSGINVKVFEFLTILESLSIFLGDGWLDGVLQDF